MTHQQIKPQRTLRTQRLSSLRRFAIFFGTFAVIFFSVGSSFSALAQEPTPTPAASPTPQELQVPAIAPDFYPAQKPLPELGRVGVDMDRQRPLSIREALAMALENNKDIEVARQNVKIAEFDLRARVVLMIRVSAHLLTTNASTIRFRVFSAADRMALPLRATTPELPDSKDNHQGLVETIAWISHPSARLPTISLCR